MCAPLLARALGAAALIRALAARACAELRVGERAVWLDDHEMAAQTVRKELEIAPAAAPSAATSIPTLLAAASRRTVRPADHRTLQQVP